jgi:hypothetical protein
MQVVSKAQDCAGDSNRELDVEMTAILEVPLGQWNQVADGASAFVI